MAFTTRFAPELCDTLAISPAPPTWLYADLINSEYDNKASKPQPSTHRDSCCYIIHVSARQQDVLTNMCAHLIDLEGPVTDKARFACPS